MYDHVCIMCITCQIGPKWATLTQNDSPLGAKPPEALGASKAEAEHQQTSSDLCHDQTSGGAPHELEPCLAVGLQSILRKAVVGECLFDRICQYRGWMNLLCDCFRQNFYTYIYIYTYL